MVEIHSPTRERGKVKRVYAAKIVSGSKSMRRRCARLSKLARAQGFIDPLDFIVVYPTYKGGVESRKKLL